MNILFEKILDRKTMMQNTAVLYFTAKFYIIIKTQILPDIKKTTKKQQQQTKKTKQFSQNK